MKGEQMGNYIKKELFEIYENLGIYANPVIKNRSYGRGFLDGVREGLRVISGAPTVDAIEIPENATCGDIIMKVLESAGNYKQEESNDVMYIYEAETPKLMRAAVDGKLWNKPFMRGREEMY